MSALGIAFYSLIAVSVVVNLAACVMTYFAERYERNELTRRSNRLAVLRDVAMIVMLAALTSRLLYVEVGG